MNSIFQFLAQIVARFLAKSPKFFRIFQVLSLAIGALSAGIKIFAADATISGSPFFKALASGTAVAVEITAFIFAGLPVSSDSKLAEKKPALAAKIVRD